MRPNLLPAVPLRDMDSLALLRAAIDGVDDQILDLVERRLALAAEIGSLKPPVGDTSLKLRPDREAEVVERLVAAATPQARTLVLSLWRELMSAGLAAQHPLEVVVWGGADPARSLEAARRRFGSSASVSMAASPDEALERAEVGHVAALLSLDPANAWWADLPRRRPNLWIFDAVEGGRDRLEPSALAVGRVTPQSLAGPVTFRVSTGGGGGLDDGRWRLLAVTEGARLYSGPSADGSPPDRALGVVGRAPGFSIRPPL